MEKEKKMEMKKEKDTENRNERRRVRRKEVSKRQLREENTHTLPTQNSKKTLQNKYFNQNIWEEREQQFVGKGF